MVSDSLLTDSGDIISDIRMDINGQPLNPVSREYPRNYIRTGISAIDGLTTLIAVRSFLFSQEMAFLMTSWRPRSCSRHH